MSNFGVPTKEQLTKINQLAKRTLSEDEVFVFSNKSAGDLMIPNRYTKLGVEFLKVLADDAKKGVSFMYNHNWTSYEGLQGVPYGKLFDGKLSPSVCEGETTELHLTKYIVRDDEAVDGMSANALIKKIETGILSDTSIGFSTDIMKCSICAENYFSSKCRHWRGQSYEMGDGTQKVCTVTAMPPSVIIPYNNNALFEESIVWDGAYPGAMVTQSKHGDIIETSSGKFSILDEKEELPEKTPILGRYCNGNIITMIKKADHKKIHVTCGLSADKLVATMSNDATTEPETVVKLINGDGEVVETIELKGGEKMDEAVKNMLEAFEVEFNEEEFDAAEMLNQVAEKYAAIPEAEGETMELSTEYVGIPKHEIVESLGIEDVFSDEILRLAKEGQEYHRTLTEEAVAMGVRAMGNAFPAETWEKNFAKMSTKEIKDIMKTWELQANAEIPAGRATDPQAGEDKVGSLPDEAHKVG